MQQVKMFVGIETDLAGLERNVNAWIAESKVKVVNIFGNLSPQTPSPAAVAGGPDRRFSPSDVLMVVVYEKA